MNAVETSIQYNPSMSGNHLQFSPDPVTFFVKSLLTGLACIIFFPAPKLLLEWVSYSLDNARLSDGTRAHCTATLAQVSQPLMIFTAVIWGNIILGRIFRESLLMASLVSLALIAVNAYAAFLLLNILIGHTRSSNGSQLRFQADFQTMTLWQIAIWAGATLPTLVVALLPIGGVLKTFLILPMIPVSFGLAIAASYFYTQWFIAQIGGGRPVVFRAGFAAFFLHYVGFLLFSLLLITIPWSTVWFSKWLGSQTEIPAGGASAAA